MVSKVWRPDLMDAFYKDMGVPWFFRRVWKRANYGAQSEIRTLRQNKEMLQVSSKLHLRSLLRIPHMLTNFTIGGGRRSATVFRASVTYTANWRVVPRKGGKGVRTVLQLDLRKDGKDQEYQVLCFVKKGKLIIIMGEPYIGLKVIHERVPGAFAFGLDGFDEDEFKDLLHEQGEDEK